jgi:ribosomal protein S27AE
MYNSANLTEGMGLIMLNGICPKCESSAIYTDSSIRGKGNSYGLNKVAASGSIIFLHPRMVEYDNYLCARCGYLERYVTNLDNRKDLVANWERVNGKEQPVS